MAGRIYCRIAERQLESANPYEVTVFPPAKRSGSGRREWYLVVVGIDCSQETNNRSFQKGIAVRTQLLGGNVVVAARQFNPTIFDQLWLVGNGIALTDEVQGEGRFVFTPPFVQLRTPQFALLVLPEQLQFAPDPVTEDSGVLVVEKVGAIVGLLPQTPYTAVGLNFAWHLIPEPVEYRAFCKELFFRSNPLFSPFEADDARFGGYLSRDILGTRLKLDVKPVVTGSDKERAEVLQFAFNFHVDIERADAVEKIQQTLERWNEARNYARQIISALEDWQWK